MRVVRAGVDLQLLELLATEVAARQHAANGALPLRRRQGRECCRLVARVELSELLAHERDPRRLFRRGGKHGLVSRSRDHVLAILLRRAGENRGLTRPELAVLLSTSKMALQRAIEAGDLSVDPTLDDELLAAFPKRLQAEHRDALLGHRLRQQIVATKIANRFVNRMGITTPLDLTEEEGTTLAHAATAFVAA